MHRALSRLCLLLFADIPWAKENYSLAHSREPKHLCLDWHMQNLGPRCGKYARDIQYQIKHSDKQDG